MHVSCLRIKVRNLLQVICMSYRSLIFELPYKSAYDKKNPHSFLQMTITDLVQKISNNNP